MGPKSPRCHFHHTQHPILQSFQRGKDSETREDGAKAADEKVLPSRCFGAPDSPPKVQRNSM
jgi:hypothetical protein